MLPVGRRESGNAAKAYPPPPPQLGVPAEKPASWSVTVNVRTLNTAPCSLPVTQPPLGLRTTASSNAFEGSVLISQQASLFIHANRGFLHCSVGGQDGTAWTNEANSVRDALAKTFGGLLLNIQYGPPVLTIWTGTGPGTPSSAKLPPSTNAARPTAIPTSRAALR
jgi:hypothetical protein